MAVPVRTQLTVRFDVPGERRGPLTLGQRNVLRWLGSGEEDRSGWLPAFVELDGSRPVADVLAAIGVLLARHEALRTRFELGAAPEQVVRTSGELPVAVRELVGDPREFVGELLWPLLATPFDPATDLPVQALVVTRGGAPVVVVLLLSHVAVDAAGAALVGAQCAELVAGGDRSPEVRGRQPLEQAEWERSPAGERRSRSALRYWEARLREAPQALFAVPRTGAPGQREVRMVSKAVAAALRVLVARTGAGHSAVVLAAGTALVAHRTATRAGALVSICGNRFRSAWRDYVGPLAQDALVPFAVDPDGVFDDLARQAQSATINAYRYAQFDSAELWPVIDAVGHARGARFHRDCVFNDLGVHGDLGVGEAVDPAALLGETELGPMPTRSLPTAFLLTLGAVSGTEADVRLHADTAALPDVEGFLLALEKLLVAAAAGPLPVAEIGAVTGIEPVERGPSWRVLDACWVDLAAVCRVLGPDARVRVEDGRITAHVRSEASPVELHAAAVAGLAGNPGAMAPHHYEVVSAAGVRSSGSGR